MVTVFLEDLLGRTMQFNYNILPAVIGEKSKNCHNNIHLQCRPGLCNKPYKLSLSAF